MLGEAENRFSLTRTALGPGGRAKSKFLPVTAMFCDRRSASKPAAGRGSTSDCHGKEVIQAGPDATKLA